MSVQHWQNPNIRMTDQNCLDRAIKKNMRKEHKLLIFRNKYKRIYYIYSFINIYISLLFRNKYKGYILNICPLYYWKHIIS